MLSAADGERLRQPDVDDGVASCRIVVIVGKPAEPAERLAAIGHAGVPVTHRREMREARMVVSTAVHDRHLAVLVQALETNHRRVKSESLADFDDLAFWNAQMGTRAVIRRVAERYDSVQAIVAAGQFDDDEDALGVFLDARPLERLRRQRGGGAGNEHRQGGADADPIEAAREEVASRTAARHSTPLLSNRSELTESVLRGAQHQIEQLA